MSIDVKDLAVRAVHTFWQSFLAVIGVTWAASGLDISQITDIESAKKFALAALAAVGAALLSAVKSTIKTLTSGTVGQDLPALPDTTDADSSTPSASAGGGAAEAIPANV
jgi:hypothetical protein